MSGSYDNGVATSEPTRLHNLLAALSLNLAGECQDALERSTGLTGSAAAALLALAEFLGDAHVGRLADVLGLTHSGAVRLVTQLEAAGFAERRPGADRRRVEVRLTDTGHRRAEAARAARESVLQSATSELTGADSATLEDLLAQLVDARVTARVRGRQDGGTGPWWCRTCDFAACGRPEGRCPAQLAAAAAAHEG